MFFPERVISVKKGDSVLEIGPGATPHPLSTIFLEKEFDSDEELIAQSGHVGVLETNKKVIHYSGDKFPFSDREFDYVICSHVLEHVDDVPHFLAEIFRVAKRGYLEFPTIYYDYLHNIEEHLNMLLYKEGAINWCKKSETPIADLSEFTNFFRELQFKGFRFQSEINNLWHQGFEWEGSVPEIHVANWKELTYTKEQLKSLINNPNPRASLTENVGVKLAIKNLARAIKSKFKTR
jgi:ubiquinone/menaquinone biosynthesis C-methylase UbiE